MDWGRHGSPALDCGRSRRGVVELIVLDDGGDEEHDEHERKEESDELMGIV